jgi:hypothetical protein
MKGVLRISVIGLVALGLLVPASAGAEVVTVGSPLTASFSPTLIGQPATFIDPALPELGANVTSPISGVVIRWRITQAIGGPFKLRVLTPGAGNIYAGAGTSAPQTPSSVATQTYATNLPIKAGQTIGVDNANASDQEGAAGVSGSAFAFFVPPLADGSSGTATGPSFGAEFGFNADVATIPSNSYSFDGVALNKKTGTATLAVVVPGPGTLSLTGKGVKAQRTGREATASKAVSTAGVVNLLVKVKGKAKKKLNKTGKAKVKVKVTYTPTGDAPGVPSIKTKSVKLRKG